MERDPEIVNLLKATEQNTHGAGTPTGPTRMANQGSNKEQNTLLWLLAQTLSPSLSCFCRCRPHLLPVPSTVFTRPPQGLGREPWCLQWTLAPTAVRAPQLWTPGNVLLSPEKCELEHRAPRALSPNNSECDAPGKLYSLLHEQDSAHRSRRSGDFTRPPRPPPPDRHHGTGPAHPPQSGCPQPHSLRGEALSSPKGAPV